MVTRNEAFKNKQKFFNAGNVDRPTVVTIAFDKMETLENLQGERDEKCVLYFENDARRLALNGVNWDACVEITGQEDSKRWAGHQIEIFPTTTEMAGKVKPCIRIRAPGSEGASTETAIRRPIAKTVKSEKSLKEEVDDEVPF